MNRFIRTSLASLWLVWLITFVSFCAPANAQAASSVWHKGWEKLGSRTVNLSTERDEIYLRHKGKIQKLVFEVRKASVNMKDVKVHLLTGAVLDVSVRSIIKEGGRSRIIDLPGKARTIRKIVFTYESLRLRRAEVVIWGKED